jgi:hypothetical protein
MAKKKKISPLAKALLETAGDMRKAGRMDNATHEKITLRHLGATSAPKAPPMTGPPDLLRFVSAENANFLNTFANLSDEKDILTKLEGLYAAVITPPRAIPENDIVLFQLLQLTHYHFLFSLSCLMRCHLSEAFASVRVAVDAALIASVIIDDRSAQVAYVKREKPFDKLNRYLKNLIDKGTNLHHAVPQLLKLHGICSSFASHADIGAFVHRVMISKDGDKRKIDLQYFQFANSEARRKVHCFNIFYCFVLILDLFSDYLVEERKAVSAEWRKDVIRLGEHVVQKNNEARAIVESEPQD